MIAKLSEERLKEILADVDDSACITLLEMAELVRGYRANEELESAIRLSKNGRPLELTEILKKRGL